MKDLQAPVSTKKDFPDISSLIEKVVEGNAAAAPDWVHLHLLVHSLIALSLELNAEDERVWITVDFKFIVPPSGMSLLRLLLKNSLIIANNFGFSNNNC